MSIKATKVWGGQRLWGNMLYSLVTRQEPAGKSRPCVLFCSQDCVIHPSQPISLYTLSDSLCLSPSLSLCFFFLSSIWAFQLPFKPQKYDVWCSNDLQTVSGNAHHESWKCIFPFPLWRRLHAQREIYTAIAFSFCASFSFFLSLLHPPIVLCWPIHPSIHSLSSSTYFYYPEFWILCLPVKADLTCHVHVMDRNILTSPLDFFFLFKSD